MSCLRISFLLLILFLFPNSLFASAPDAAGGRVECSGPEQLVGGRWLGPDSVALKIGGSRSKVTPDMVEGIDGIGDLWAFFWNYAFPTDPEALLREIAGDICSIDDKDFEVLRGQLRQQAREDRKDGLLGKRCWYEGLSVQPTVSYRACAYAHAGAWNNHSSSSPTQAACRPSINLDYDYRGNSTIRFGTPSNTDATRDLYAYVELEASCYLQLYYRPCCFIPNEEENTERQESDETEQGK